MKTSKYHRGLFTSAKESMEWRGHTVKYHKPYIRNGGTAQLLYCEKCGKDCVVMTNPMGNEIEIGGEAVALGCEE